MAVYWRPINAIDSGDLVYVLDDSNTVMENAPFIIVGFHVFYHPASISLTSGAVLSGFTITGGHGNGSGNPTNTGGGTADYDDADDDNDGILDGDEVRGNVIPAIIQLLLLDE